MQAGNPAESGNQLQLRLIKGQTLETDKTGIVLVFI